MLTEKDKQFIARWQAVREKESSFSHKFFSGLPVAAIFGVSILLFFLAVKIFLPSWFTTATDKSSSTVVVPEMTGKFMQLSTGNIITTFIAVVIIVLFFSYFRMHYNWENNEQLYKELKSKEKKHSHAAEQGGLIS